MTEEEIGMEDGSSSPASALTGTPAKVGSVVMLFAVVGMLACGWRMIGDAFNEATAWFKRAAADEMHIHDRYAKDRSDAVNNRK